MLAELCMHILLLNSEHEAKTLPSAVEISYKYNLITSFQSDFQPIKSAKLPYIHLSILS